MIMYQQKNKVIKKQSRVKERVAMLLVTAVLVLLFAKLHTAYTGRFIAVEEGYKNGSSINLSASFDEAALRNLLKSGNYIQDDADIAIVTGKLKAELERRGHPLENLGFLNKKSFDLDAAFADSVGGTWFKQRVAASLAQLNYDAHADAVYERNTPLPSSLAVGGGNASISVTITDGEKHGVVGVLVKLREYFSHAVESRLTADTSFFGDGGWVAKSANDTTEYVRFAMTGAYGSATFSGLAIHGSYSVLPVRRGFEYGPPKGTADLQEEAGRFAFAQKTQTIKLFDTNTYSQLKEDEALTVRTPAEFMGDFMLYFAMFLVAWWGLHIYLSVSGRPFDNIILPLIMLLTGICVLVMYSINSPLTDEMRGNEMAWGSAVGVLVLGIVCHTNLISFYNSRLFDFSGMFLGRRFNQPGYVYLVIALLLTGALFFFGTGPEGSGVKINLFFFQPSEIAKYLVVVFLAAFFQKNAVYFNSLPSAKERFVKALPAVILLAVLMGLYLKLGDMGPALVICGLFILFYSIARGDFFQLAIGAVVYCAFLWEASHLHTGTKGLFAATVLWAVLWLLYGQLSKKTFYPGAFFMMLVIAAFVFGEHLPDVGDRLKQRNQMFLNIWDNETYGGDQVAHGIWSISTGGATGMGIGNGSPRVMPASYTDMILASIGEELGFVGLLAIFIAMALLLHRSLIIARKAANPFVFYLTAGIAIVTAIQFLVIAAGCFGVMPLTGITVPFLSYGKVSMIINIAAFGLVLAASSLTGDVRQAAYIEKTYDNTITFGALSFVLATIGFAGLFLFYQIIKPDQYIVKPAVVVTKTGERFVSVNPRISLLMGKLTAGNIYDRNGLLLATADKNAMLQAKAGIVAVGVGDSIIDRQSFIKQKRYYPFGNNMFFWTGDYNSRLYWNNNAKGYFAESRHLTLLRGFNTAPKGADSVKYYRSGKYQPEQFLPAQKDSFKLALYNYEAMIPFLKAGIYSNKVDSFNKIKKDITLTVDAELQTRIQNSVRLYLDSLGTIQPEVKGWRTSVVVLDAATGEVYSSAVCPLPDYSVLKKLSLLDSAGQRTAINRLTLGDDSMFTDADLGVTFPTAPGSTAKIMSAIAGLNKAGMRADTTYNILSSEIIRKSGNDPDPTGKVDMQYAIIHSSNVYFIRLVNDFKLDNQMADVYQAAGVSVANRGNHGFEDLYDPVAWSVIRKRWAKVFNDKSRRVYYSQPTGDEKKDRDRLKSEFSGLAWGQGQMTATPLAMARVTGTVANHGVMQSAKYLIKSSLPAPVQRDSAITVTSGTNADFIAHCMHEQVATKNIADALKIDIAGKTGTPERGVFGNDKNYDGWFMFFIQSAKTKHPMAVCIRIEKAQGSGQAVRMAQHAVIPVLEQLHYLETGH